MSRKLIPGVVLTVLLFLCVQAVMRSEDPASLSQRAQIEQQSALLNSQLRMDEARMLAGWVGLAKVIMIVSASLAVGIALLGSVLAGMQWLYQRSSMVYPNAAGVYPVHVHRRGKHRTYVHLNTLARSVVGLNYDTRSGRHEVHAPEIADRESDNAAIARSQAIQLAIASGDARVVLGGARRALVSDWSEHPPAALPAITGYTMNEDEFGHFEKLLQDKSLVT